MPSARWLPSARAQRLPVVVGQVVDVLGAGRLQRGRLDALGQDRPERDEVGVDARVRLDVGVRRAEQRLGVVGGELLDGVDVLAAGVEAVPDRALGVLVREPVAHRQQHGGRGVVLAGDQLQRAALVGQFAADRARRRWARRRRSPRARCGRRSTRSAASNGLVGHGACRTRSPGARRSEPLPGGAHLDAPVTARRAYATGSDAADARTSYYRCMSFGNPDFDQYQLTDEQRMLRAARARARRGQDRARARPRSTRPREFPQDVLRRPGAAPGFHAVHIPEEYGGAGADAISACIVVEEVARVCASSSLIPAVNKLGTPADDPVRLGGAEEGGARRRSPPARRCSATRCPSARPARTPRRCAPAPCATATTGCSTARRPGSPTPASRPTTR